MRIEPNDPRLTFFLLGELHNEERLTFELDLQQQDSLAARQQIERLRSLVSRLRRSLAREKQLAIGLTEKQRRRIYQVTGAPPSSIAHSRRIGPWVIGLILAALAVGLGLLTILGSRVLHQQPPRELQTTPTTSNRFVNTTDQPQTQMPLTFGTLDLGMLQELLQAGRLSGESLRLEDLIQSLAYPLEPPDLGAAFTLALEAGPAPWAPAHLLVYVGIRGRGRPEERRLGISNPVVEGLALQLELHPKRVARYRWLGSPARAPTNVEASAVADVSPVKLLPGGQVVVLYELIPTDEAFEQMKAGRGDSEDLLTIKVTYREPGRVASKILMRGLDRPQRSFAEASPAFRYSAAVVEFGLLLLEHPNLDSGDFEQVLAIARSALGPEPRAEGAGFLRLVEWASKHLDPETRSLKKPVGFLEAP